MKLHITKLLTAAATAATIGAANADTITLWNFNSTTPDANTTTGITSPAIGSGTASVLASLTQSFASGDASGGSSDPATGDDSGWGLTTFPAVTTGSGTAGARFAVSTVGFTDIQLSLDLRTSNTASRYWQFQYSTDGISFTAIGGSTVNGVSHVLTSGGGDFWNNGWSVNLTGISGVDNNSSFAFQIVSIFSPEAFTQATTPFTAYNASEAFRASNSDDRAYASSGTARLDMVTVSGTVIPEPTTWALGGLGIAALLIFRRRTP